MLYQADQKTLSPPGEPTRSTQSENTRSIMT